MSFTSKITSDKVWPPLPTIDDDIKEYTDKVDFVTSAKILNGFDFEYTDAAGGKQTYHFSYKSDDQQNFSTQNEMALLVANNTIAQLQKQLAAAITANSGAQTLEENVPSDVVLDPDTLQTTKDFTTSWQGHTADGQTVTLIFDFNQFIKFTIAAGMHKQTTIGTGWAQKAQLRACKSKKELESYARSINLDQEIVAARDIYEKLGITPARIY